MTVFRDGGIERLDDPHIDRIDENWRSPQLWVERGLTAFRIALRLRDGHTLPVQVESVFPLQAADKCIGIEFTTQDEVTTKRVGRPLHAISSGRG